MMKTLFVFFFLFFNFGYLQEPLNDITLPTNDNGELNWTEAVEVNNVTKADLLTRAKAYMKTEKKYSNHFFSEESATGEGFDDFFLWGDNTSKFKCSYVVKIELKDNKYKYTISGLTYEQYPKPAKPTPLPFSGNDLYKEYRELIKSKKNSSKKAKNAYSIFRSTKTLMEELAVQIKTKMKEESTGSGDW